MVWLQFSHAQLGQPGILKLGDSVALYSEELLDDLLARFPNDDRLPPDLRSAGPNDLRNVWFHHLVPAAERPGAPRSYLRVEVAAMGRQERLAEAREVAEFLVAFGALGDANHDLWLLSDSYLVRGWQSTTAGVAVNADRARGQFSTDMVPLNLERHAAALGRHLPFRSPQFRLAGRLLVWLRQASAAGSPAQVVLCDRVVEQVSGWAGFSDHRRFTDSNLRSSWIYTRIRNEIQFAYRQLLDAVGGSLALRAVIEPREPRPAHAPRNYFGSTNLKAILENIDALAETELPPGRTAPVVARLRDRVSSRCTIVSWLDELGAEFDQRNAQLRRTRNALMHGGPIVLPVVMHVAPYAMALASHAIFPALDCLMEDQDLVDGFVAKQAELRRCFASLRAGEPIEIALFFDG